jgi:hypothetical protein
MDYLSADVTRQLLQGQRREAQTLRTVALTEHRRSVARRDAIFFWLKLLIIGGAIAAVWVHVQIMGLEAMYAPEFAWWRTTYRKGPRPKGDKHRDLLCVAIAAEYPPVATLLTRTCGTTEQTSAIFLLTMLQHFGDKLTAIHWSGSREQLHGDKFDAFIKDWDGWNVPQTNPWFFLFPDKSTFERSSAIEAARATSGSSILKSVYNGGLCEAAIEHFSPDTSADEMAHQLLDEMLIYKQSCDAAKLAQSIQLGGNAGGMVGAAATTFTSGLTISNASVGVGQFGAGVSSMLSGGTFAEGAATVGSSVAEASTEAAVAGVLDFGTAEVATLGTVETASAACGPFFWLCGAIGALVVTGIAVGAAYAGSAAGTAIAGAVLTCDGGDYYRLIRQPNGTYKKVAWSGDEDALKKKSDSK